MAGRPSTKRISATEALGLKLLQSVREMKAGCAARTTTVESNDVVQALENTGTGLNRSKAKTRRAKT